MTPTADTRTPYTETPADAEQWTIMLRPDYLPDIECYLIRFVRHRKVVSSAFSQSISF